MDLNVLWFLLLGVLLTGYAILDGFDFGVGILHLFTKTDLERRLLMNSIGPVWDGNEVWLVTFGGAMFAAFPNVYATVFSGFYLAFMLALCGLIFRAVALEFRSKHTSGAWRQSWDVAFSASSFLLSLLFGVAIGNIMVGLPIGKDMEYMGGLFPLLMPYPILIGLFVITLNAMHGAIYLYLKTEGELQEKVKSWVWRCFFAYLVMFLVVSVVTILFVPNSLTNIRHYPILAIIPILNALAVANIPRALYKGNPQYAFFSSACSIAALVALLGMAIFPNMVPSTVAADLSLNIYNAASSQKTLGIMAIIALMGMPFVLSYTIAIYWVFRGKVKLGHHSY